MRWCMAPSHPLKYPLTHRIHSGIHSLTSGNCATGGGGVLHALRGGRGVRAQVLSGEMRFSPDKAYPEKFGAAARFWSISAHYRTVQYILHFPTFVLLLLLLFSGASVKFQMLNLSKFVSLAFKFQILHVSKFVSLAFKFQVLHLQNLSP